MGTAQVDLRDEEMAILTGVEQRLAGVADFIRLNARRLSDSDPLREQLEEILEALDDAVDGVHGAGAVLSSHWPGVDSRRLARAATSCSRPGDRA